MKPIIVIIGPTGVGKTKLSIELAKKLDGELINGDSVAIYKRLNIGSAKPTKEEQKEAPHHLIDIKEPTEEYSVYDYQQDARKKIDEITIDNQTEHSITLPEITLPQGATNVNVSITGNYQTTNETNTLNINGTEYNNGAFAINTTELPTQLIVTPTSIEDSIQMTNINYTVT